MVEVAVLMLLLPERDEGRDGCCITKDLLLPFSSSPFFPCPPPLFSSSTLPVTLALPSPLSALKEASCCTAAANELTAGDEPAERMREQTDQRERERERKGKRVV